MRAAVKIPVSVKIRLGWNKDSLNYLELARAIDAGADAIMVHGGRARPGIAILPTGTASRKSPAVPVPVVGNGDLSSVMMRARLAGGGCAAVMVARGVLIKPWLFSELESGYLDISADERVALYRRYVALGLEHWGDDAHGRTRLREFLRWHMGFWCRYAPQRPDGTWPTMQQRESVFVPRSPLEALLARTDDAALDYVTEQLLDEGDLANAPAAGVVAAEADLLEAG
jgi:tRNA-dihydrouridine synthase 3